MFPVISTPRKSKPFIASSVTLSPSLPPPLVLPSEVRRHSITNAQQSRSKSNSPSRIGPGHIPPTSKVVTHTPTRAFHTPITSTVSGPVKIKTTPPSVNNSTQPARTPRRQHVSNPPAPPPVVTPEKLSFGKKLRKAFSFGKKKPADRAATMSGSNQPPNFGQHQHTKTKSMTLTSANRNITQRHTMTSPPSVADFSGFSSVLERPRLPSKSSFAADDKSSIHSSASFSSISKLKRMGNQLGKDTKSLFNRNNQISSQVDSLAVASATTTLVPKTAVSTPSDSAASAIVPHVVSDTEKPTGSVPIKITLSDSQPDQTAEKNGSGSESDEDLNAADTVFPKNLDSVAVETIRSSLERSKSLERRRSRRSTRSVKSTDSGKRQSSVIPNALEVHVPSSSASISDPDKIKKHMPAHGILKELNTSPSTMNGFNLAGDSGLDPKIKKYKSSLKRPNSSNSISQLVGPHPDVIPRAYSSNSISMRRTSRSTTPSAAIIGNPGSVVKFSSRIVIYDTYDSLDYDRRAEISTCNRLNPTLARQIREELNSFKMEMEVHESSRIFTHYY